MTKDTRTRLRTVEDQECSLFRAIPFEILRGGGGMENLSIIASTFGAKIA